MAGIELVIKIPERIHYGIEKGIIVNGSKASQILIDAVKNGIPLPKGHGKLIDSDILDKRLRYLFNHKGYSKNLIGTGISLAMGENLDMYPIIEADKEQEDE